MLDRGINVFIVINYFLNWIFYVYVYVYMQSLHIDYLVR